MNMSIGNKGLNRERLRDNILAAIGDQTYREIAEAIDCNPILVGQWARGEKSPGLEMVVKLSRYTGVSMDDLTEGVLSASAEKSIKMMHPKGEWLEREVFDEPQGKRIEQWQSAKCSVCGLYHTTPYQYYFEWFNYCPSCGADMRPKRGVNV
jgi:transcriptional regulator with XRE-family HTH domain